MRTTQVLRLVLCVVLMLSACGALVGQVPRTPRTPGAPTGDQVVEIVSLRFLDPGDAASFVVDFITDNTPGLAVRAISGGKLILRGPEGAVHSAIATISALDNESVLPRPIRIRLAANVVFHDEKIPPAELSTESVGAEGHPIPLNISSESTESYEVTMNVISGEKLIEQKTPQFIRRPSNLFVTLTPTIGAEGRVILVGSGRIDCNVAGADPRSTWQVAKDFEVAVSAEHGLPITIAAGEVSLGKDRAEFVVTATAIMETGRVQIPPPTPQPTRPGYGGYGGNRYGGGYGNYGGYGGYGGGYGAYQPGASPVQLPPGYMPIVGPSAPKPEEQKAAPPPEVRGGW